MPTNFSFTFLTFSHKKKERKKEKEKRRKRTQHTMFTLKRIQSIFSMSQIYDLSEGDLIKQLQDPNKLGSYSTEKDSEQNNKALLCVIEALEKFPKNAKIQTLGLKSVLTFSKRLEYGNTLRTNLGLLSRSNNCEDYPTMIKIFLSLIVDESTSSTIKSEVSTEVATKILSIIETSENDKEIQVSGVTLVNRIMQAHPESKRVITSYNYKGMELIVNRIDVFSDSPNGFLVYTRFLRTLLSDSDQCLYFSGKKGYSTLFRVLTEHFEEEYILSCVLDILLKTISFKYYRNSTIPFTEYVVKIADNTSISDTLNEKAVKYLFYVSLYGTFDETKDLSRNEIDGILSSMQEHIDNENIIIYGTLALNNIHTRFGRIKEFNFKSVDENIFSGMERHIDNETVQYVCLVTLANLFKDSCTEYALTDGIHIIKKCLDSHRENIDVNIAAFELLGRVAVNGREETKIFIVKEIRCLSRVLSLITSFKGNTDILISGLSLIKRLYSTPKVAEVIYDGDSEFITKLCKILTENTLNQEVLIHLCRALTMFAQNPIWCETMHVLKVTQNITRFFSDSTDATVICACCDLLSVLHANSDNDTLDKDGLDIINALDRTNSRSYEDIATKCYELISVLMDKDGEKITKLFLNRYRLEKLIETARSFENNVTLQTFCCKVLHYIFKYSIDSSELKYKFNEALDIVLPKLGEGYGEIKNLELQTYALNISILATTKQFITVNVSDVVQIMAAHTKDPLIQQLGCNLLERIKGFNPQAVSSILSALLTHPNSVIVQKYGLFALNTALMSGISLNEDSYTNFINHVVIAMGNFPECCDIQILGLLIIYNFISSEPKIIKQNGLIGAVLSASKELNFGRHNFVKLHTLEKIAFLDKDKVGIITDRGGIYEMVNLMSVNRNINEGEFLILGFYALASFISNQSICEYLFNENEILSIFIFLKEIETYRDTRLFVWAFLVMGKLSYYSNLFRMFFIDNNFHQLIARVMFRSYRSSDETEIRKKHIFEAGCFALANIMYDYQKSAPNNDIVEAITLAINSKTSITSQICGCSALRNLCHNSYLRQTVMNSPQAINAIFSCVKSPSPEVQLFGINTLGLFGRIASFRLLVLKNGGIKTILNMAEKNIENEMIRSASISVLALMTYQYDLSSDMEIRGLLQDEDPNKKVDIKSFGPDILAAGSFAIKVLGLNNRAESDVTKDSLTILWNAVPYYNENNILCRNEIQVIYNHIFHTDENIKYALCVLSALVDSNNNFCFPLTHIATEVVKEPIECVTYALKILKSAKQISINLENMDTCIKNLSVLFGVHPTLRLQIIHTLNNLVFMFSKETCGPMAEELIKMLPSLNVQDVPKVFIECYFQTLMWALSDDVIHQKFFNEETKALISRLHERYESLSDTVDKCFKAIIREKDPSLTTSYEKGICTCNSIKLCKHCPARTNGRFCPVCCCQQEMYVCDVCKHPNGSKKKFCLSCWESTHYIGSSNETHTFTKRFISSICDHMKLKIIYSPLDDF